MKRGICLVATGASLLVSAASCVGDSQTSNDGGSDAASDVVVATDSQPDQHAMDAGDAAPSMCDVAKAFGAPTLVTELDTSGYEGHFRLAAGELSGYFISQRADGGALAMYSASRPNLTAPFANVTAIATAAAAGGTAYPTVTADDLNLYFSGTAGIVLATRPNTQTTFGTASPVLGLATFTMPFIREDGLVMYVQGSSQIYRATQATSGFNAPTLVTELQVSNVAQGFPTVTADDLVIYYESVRTDVSQGGEDIWVATRATTSDPFGNLHNVTELNTARDDKPTFITRDRCTLYFERRSIDDAGVAKQEIWVATKTP